MLPRAANGRPLASRNNHAPGRRQCYRRYREVDEDTTIRRRRFESLLHSRPLRVNAQAFTALLRLPPEVDVGGAIRTQMFAFLPSSTYFLCDVADYRASRIARICARRQKTGFDDAAASLSQSVAAVFLMRGDAPAALSLTRRGLLRARRFQRRLTPYGCLLPGFVAI